MPPNNNLAQQLGELNGQLSHIVPALEHMEKRMTEMGTELTETKTNLAHAVRELREQKESSGEQFALLNSEIRVATQANLDQTKEIEALKKLVEEKKKRGWEVALIVISAGLSAFLTWLVTHVSVKGP